MVEEGSHKNMDVSGGVDLGTETKPIKRRTELANGEIDGVSGGDGESDEHDVHIWTERERRKRMRDMFTNLHSLLPHIPPKADKSTIVDEAVKYIKKLENVVEELKLRSMIARNGSTHLPREGLGFVGSTSNLIVAQASPNMSTNHVREFNFDVPVIFKTWTSANVILSLCGKEAHFNICSVKKPGLLTAVCFVMEKYKLEVVSAQVSSDYGSSMFMFHARASEGIVQFGQQDFGVEQVYKQAAAEIILWVNS